MSKNTLKNLVEDLKEMSEGAIDDPLGLDEMLAKECVICNEKDHQEDVVETPEGWAHSQCISEQDIAEAEESNHKLEI